MPRLLYLFALCNLVIGTGAFVISGILAPISMSLGVSIATSGQAMTAYALSTAVLAPLALVLTGSWPRRRALAFGMAVFAAGNALCALAPGFTVLLTGRVLMGVGAMFTPIAAGIAVALVEPARRGRALSLVFLGISLSYVIGLPLGAWLGFRFGWQWPVGMVAVVALLSFGALLLLLPRDIAAPGASFKGLGELLARGPVMWTLSLTLLYFTAIFVVFAYIGPVLQALQPMSGTRMSVTLALFGVSGVVGTLVGGWANDRFGARRTLLVQLGVLGAMMALLPLTRGHYAAGVGHRGLRHDGAAAIAAGGAVAGAGPGAAVAEHVDAVLRHRARRSHRRRRRGAGGVRASGLGGRAVRDRRPRHLVDGRRKAGASQAGMIAGSPLQSAPPAQTPVTSLRSIPTPSLALTPTFCLRLALVARATGRSPLDPHVL
jgi:DHA1 family inner membrane transport protein